MNKILKLIFLCILATVVYMQPCHAQDTAKKAVVYGTFDEPPVPPGGDEGYAKYLSKHIIYPDSALKAGAQGTVIISIVVDKDGTLSDVHVLKDPAGYGCGAEAVRVIKSMPPWKPGRMNGVPIKVRYSIPIRFNAK